MTADRGLAEIDCVLNATQGHGLETRKKQAMIQNHKRLSDSLFPHRMSAVIFQEAN